VRGALDIWPSETGRHEMREAAAAYCGAPIDLEMTTAHIYAAHMTPA
jgi:hypothetical protein